MAKPFLYLTLKNYWHLLAQKKLAAIDLEPINSKAYRVKHKFLSQEEVNLAKDDEIATLMWCAKECLYKYTKKEN